MPAGFWAGSLLPAWRTGGWVSHLWFLVVLAVYFAGMALAAPFLRRLARPGVVAWLEGRHALDGLSSEKLDSEELEFRAKLSEVAFSERPRVSFGGIFNPNMADKTSPHGRANKRIAKGILDWMNAHAGEIAALDANRPRLPQFDKLTDDQMRAAMRSMDPWAR